MYFRGVGCSVECRTIVSIVREQIVERLSQSFRARHCRTVGGNRSALDRLSRGWPGLEQRETPDSPTGASLRSSPEQDHDLAAKKARWILRRVVCKSMKAVPTLGKTRSFPPDRSRPAGPIGSVPLKQRNPTKRSVSWGLRRAAAQTRTGDLSFTKAAKGRPLRPLMSADA